MKTASISLDQCWHARGPFTSPGVGAFAIEWGLVAAEDEPTTIRIRMLNSGAKAIAMVQTTGGQFSVTRSALLRTPRKLMDGHVYVPGGIAEC